MHAKGELVHQECNMGGQTEAGSELIASLIMRNGSKALATSKHRNNFLSRIKLRISKLSKKLRENSKKVALRNGSTDERLINFKKSHCRSRGKFPRKLSSAPAVKKNSKNVHRDKTLPTNEAKDDSSMKKMRKKKRSKWKHRVEVDEASRLQRRTRYLVIKMKLNQNLIDAYSGEGWKGQSREKIKPLAELQQAMRRILNCKLGIRDAIRQLDTLGSVGSIENSVIAPNGVVHHEHIFCAKCRMNEVFPDNDIILCDGTCNCAFHQKCLDPPLETESIPPGEQGWFCKYCECKMEIIEAMNAHLGTQFPLDSHWQDIFKEEAALPDGEVHMLDLEEKWPSDDSEDYDYNPKRRTTVGCTSFAETDNSMSHETNSSTSLSWSLDSEVLSASAASEQEREEMCHADYAKISEEPSIISGPRHRATVDYKKLYNEMFGKDAPVCEVISEDEDWGPSRKRRRQKESDAADTLLTLYESNRNFLNPEISEGNKEITHESSKRRVFRLPSNAVEKLRQVFSENELPSRSVRETLSKDLGIRLEKVNKWFKNARYTALKSRKFHKEPEESTSPKTVPLEISAQASSVPPKDSEKIVQKKSAKSLEKTKRKMLKRRFPDARCPQINEGNVDFDDNICLKKLLMGKKKKGVKGVGFATDDGLQERESELECLFKIESRLDNLRQRLLTFQLSECKPSDESTLCKPSVIYVPIAVIKEKA